MLKDTFESKGIHPGDHVTISTDVQGLLRLFHTKASGPTRPPKGVPFTHMHAASPAPSPGTTKGASAFSPAGVDSGTPTVQQRRGPGRPLKRVSWVPGVEEGVRVSGKKRASGELAGGRLSVGGTGPAARGDAGHSMEEEEEEEVEERQGAKRRKKGRFGESREGLPTSRAGRCLRVGAGVGGWVCG